MHKYPINSLRLSITLSITLLLVLVMAACTAATADTPDTVARRIIDKAGKTTVKITNIVHGNEKYRGVDQLWCVETDAVSANDQTPYLLVVWRKNNVWDGAVLTDGEYEWDLNGCQR